MSVKGVAQIQRELVMTHLQTGRWTRSHVASIAGAAPVPDPGYGRDEICPVLFYGQPFDPSKPADVAALSTYAVRELRGYGYYLAAITGGTWDGQELPLNLVDRQWELETGSGPVAVVPQASVQDGATAVPFTAEGHADFTANITASYLHGVGFVVVNLAEMQAEGVDVGSKGSQMSKVMVRFMIAAAPPSAPVTPEVYAATLGSLFRGIMWVSDPNAAEGELLRDMADSGVLIVRNYRRRDPIQERPNRISEHSGWVWFTLQLVVRCQYRLPVAGRQSPTL